MIIAGFGVATTDSFRHACLRIRRSALCVAVSQIVEDRQKTWYQYFSVTPQAFSARN